MTRYFSEKKRVPHLGFYPSERLSRQDDMPDLDTVPEMARVRFDDPESELSIINAMRDYQAMLDALRSGLINKGKSEIPDDLMERSQHLKSFAYFQDVSIAGITAIDAECHLKGPIVNHDICLLYTSPSPRDLSTSRMPSSA